jgi:processive 1,2-diacylglycerol beta-glucosyltransferase
VSRVLLLSVSAGAGHVRDAEAVEVGPVAELFARLQAAARPAPLVVVAGRNEKLQRVLRRAAGPRAAVLGFTTEIDEWMAAADLLVTKPGGLTTSEASGPLDLCALSVPRRPLR